MNKTWNEFLDEHINDMLARKAAYIPAPCHLMTAREVYDEMTDPKVTVEHETVIRRITK